MSSKLKFGLYTSFYNCERFVELAFSNVEALKYENFEWHITDDYSEDNTKSLLLKRLEKSPIKDKIKYYDQEIKKEMYWSPNNFFDYTFDWIILIDSDDLIDINSLELYNRMISENPEIGLISSDFHKRDSANLLSISYILNDEKISNKIERYHPEVDYLRNLSYSCFGVLRGFKNSQFIKFKVENQNAGAEDSYHIFWCNSHGKYLHVPRPTYEWLVRNDSESHSLNFGKHFNDNFEGALERLKRSDWGVVTRYNTLYKETCALGSYNIGKLSNKHISLFTRDLNKEEIRDLKSLYFDTFLSVNKPAGEINIIVANYYTESELIELLSSLKNTGDILIYYQNDKKHKDNIELHNETDTRLNRLSSITGSTIGPHSFFNYIRHVIINAKN